MPEEGINEQYQNVSKAICPFSDYIATGWPSNHTMGDYIISSKVQASICTKSHVSAVRLTRRNLFANFKLLHKHHITYIALQSVLSSVERFSGGLVVLEELCGKKCKFFSTGPQLPVEAACT